MLKKSLLALSGLTIGAYCASPALRNNIKRRVIPIYTVCVVALDYKINYPSWKNRDIIGHEEFKKQVKKVDSREAKRVLKALRSLGGIYIKGGQFLSTMKGMIPREWTEAMNELTDNGKCFNYEDIKIMVKKDLGKTPEELFESFDPVFF